MEKIRTREIPVTLLEREGLATARPEAALDTETAGVSTPSAIVNPVAKRHWIHESFKGIPET
jgi:hypothetical protein